ncbi:hypothetical protein C8F01DRAFT_1323424 [Mycena amicta]|nr:hypothetical protein C8F01DRAFT_1323424 [Mycena amicta]
MFAENESESPRPIPRLVPEQDDGNVEYKLQLLSPSPGRFARLVTQMKWRLLEGGGQAYYELGVADSGLLVGLPRAELEQSLETLEMMAGEIGASVIVVKEIEVPAAMLDLTPAFTAYLGRINGHQHRDRAVRTDVDDDISTSLKTGADNIFSMDDLDYELDPAVGPQCHFSIEDLEIASVYKPRPVRERSQAHAALPNKKNRQKGKKGKHIPDGLRSSPLPHESDGVKTIKAQKRRNTRDRKREDRAQAVVEGAEKDKDKGKENTSQTDTLVTNLETLHVSVDPDPDDVFPSVVTTLPGPFTGLASSHLRIPVDTTAKSNTIYLPPRLIVEALVVRKMSLEEAFWTLAAPSR